MSSSYQLICPKIIDLLIFNLKYFQIFKMMLENSMGSLQQYPCSIHRKERVTHICSDFKCTQNPFCCMQCFNENLHKNFHGSHEQYITPFTESINSFAGYIDSQKSQMDKMYQTTALKKQNEGLLKKIETSERHYQFIDNHIKNIKGQVQKEVQFLINEFQKRILTNKQNLFTQLENYQKNYVQNMEICRGLVQPLMVFNKKFKYYSNPNNICLKLFSEIKKKSFDWFIELKKTLNMSSKIMEKPQNYHENLIRTTQYMNPISQELPYFKSPDMNEIKKQQLFYMSSEILNDFVNLKQIKAIQNNQIASNQNYRSPNSQRELMDRNRLPLKPSKI